MTICKQFKAIDIHCHCLSIQNMKQIVLGNWIEELCRKMPWLWVNHPAIYQSTLIQSNMTQKYETHTESVKLCRNDRCGMGGSQESGSGRPAICSS